MIGRIFRVLAGLLLLPACYALSRSFCQVLVNSQASASACLCLFGGVAAFLLCWLFLPHPVKTYVFGHELTHVLWGLLFFARPSKLRVGEKGGSVNLTKSNFLITLAPYFFPFYTFIVIVAALVTSVFLRPLPFLPLWMFLIGFTWAFHVLFTLETLTQRQPDVKLYGRVFSWTVIFIVNVALVLVWLAATTSLTFSALGAAFVHRFLSVYAAVGTAAWSAGRRLVNLF